MKSRISIVLLPSGEWRATIEPRGPQDYEANNLKGAVQGPYGDSYWQTAQEAAEFVGKVLTDEENAKPRPWDIVTPASPSLDETIIGIVWEVTQFFAKVLWISNRRGMFLNAAEAFNDLVRIPCDQDIGSDLRLFPADVLKIEVD